MTIKTKFDESAVTRDDEGKFSSSGGSGGGGKPSKEWEAKYGHKARQNKKFLDSKSGKIAKAKASNQSVIRDLHGNLVITSDNPINHSVRGEDGKFHMVAEIVHNKNSQSYKEEEQKQAEAKKKFERSELGKRIMADVAERKKRNLAKSDAARAAAEKKKKSGDWRAAVPQFESSPGQMSLLDQPESHKAPTPPPASPDKPEHAPPPPPPKKTQAGLFGDSPDEEDDADDSDNPDDFPLFSKARDKAVAARKKTKSKSGAGSPQGTLFETRKQPTLFSLASIMQAEFYARGYYRTLGIPIHEISGIFPKTPETVENS